MSNHLPYPAALALVEAARRCRTHTEPKDRTASLDEVIQAIKARHPEYFRKEAS